MQTQPRQAPKREGCKEAILALLEQHGGEMPVKELEEELRKAENEAERIKEAEARLSKRVSELEKSLEDQRRERREICGAAANVHLYAQLGGEKAASRELKGILQVIAKESRKIAERMDA